MFVRIYIIVLQVSLQKTKVHLSHKGGFFLVRKAGVLILLLRTRFFFMQCINSVCSEENIASCQACCQKVGLHTYIRSYVANYGSEGHLLGNLSRSQ